MKNSSLKIKVIGIGGLGSDFLLLNKKNFFQGADLIVIDDEIGKIPDGIRENVRKIVIEDGFKHVKTYSKIVEELTGFDLVYVVAGIGGNIGSNISLLIGEITKNFSIPTFGYFILPFGFEGIARKNNETIEQINIKYPGAIFFENDEILNNSDKKAAVKDLLIHRNREIGDLIDSSIVSLSEVLMRRDNSHKKEIEYSDLVDKKDFFKKENIYVLFILLCIFFYFVYSSQKDTIKDLSSVINQNIEELPKNIESALDACSKNSEILRKVDIHDCLLQNKLEYFKVHVAEENTFLIEY